MANYVKSTNFAVKDGLPSGDPQKVVKGTEIDTEFNNISTAVNSKSDASNPTFLGTPFAPTASPGTATNQIATTAFVQAVKESLHPVGSIYINATNSTNPGTLLGFGTWAAFGAGRVPVGFNAADSLFDTAEETGGSKDAIVVSHTHTVSSSGTTGGQSANHFHGFSATTSTAGAHTHGITDPGHAHTYDFGPVVGPTNTGGGSTTGPVSTGTATTGISINSAGDHTHTVSGNTGNTSGDHTHNVTVSGTAAASGSSGTNANLQPYITVFMWKRTA